jgi:hypothetical protein
MHKNFYKNCLLKLLSPISTFKHEWIRDVGETIQNEAQDNIEYNCGEIIIRISNIMKLCEWVFSEEPVEALDE